jgi:hypothetical protein
MKRYMLALLFCLLPSAALAWNAAGHRLVASIAWQQLNTSSKEKISNALVRHPDYAHWQEKSRSDNPAAIFAEAATWADSIRHDPRFYDETRELPTPPIPGLPDNARHKHWHYVDLTADGRAGGGELDRQIERLSQLLRTTGQTEELTWALPWLLHLVGDIHQPLHVGHAEDEGGNRIEIENPLKGRQPFMNLHTYWDNLPGPSALRGRRLDTATSNLLALHPAPRQGDVGDWRRESQALLHQAYPEQVGSLLPLITESFQQQSRTLAEKQLVAAGYRLGRLLESIFNSWVSRETR